MNYSKMMQYDASNWDGITATIFFSGCGLHCPGCFNKELWDFNHGHKFDKKAEEKFISYAKNEHVTGVCLLGGEVFQQDLNVILELVIRLEQEVRKPIHVWSGYTIEELWLNEKARAILYHIDTLVDGRFIFEKRDLRLKYRGSSNQRVIDVKRTLEEGVTTMFLENIRDSYISEVIEYEKEE